MYENLWEVNESCPTGVKKSEAWQNLRKRC
jgi:hypothetical protein